VEARIAALRNAPGTDPSAPVPVDLVTASGSGLDPHVSPASAYYQVGRIAAARQVPADEVRRIVVNRLEGRQLGILGEPRVNVLLVNLDLDEAFGPAPESLDAGLPLGLLPFDRLPAKIGADQDEAGPEG